MKVNYIVLILVHAIYLIECQETPVSSPSEWKSSGNRLTDSHLRELAKIAKIRQSHGPGVGQVEEAGPGSGATRLSRSFTRHNSRRSRLDADDGHEVGETGDVATRKETEVGNNTEVAGVSRSSSIPEVTTEMESQPHPGRRESAGKRKQPSKLTISPKPGITEGTPKPTKYHYYPHNQHIYLLPECAIQQVCNAVYVRLNYTQPLCACPSRKEPCSASLNADDLHTTELVTASTGKVLTLVKTCEPVAEMRICRAPRDWSLLALQNVRTGKSHYLVICRCPHKGRLEGPMSHDQPAYASVPGIRVYGMMCVRDSYRISRPFRYRRSVNDVVPVRKPQFPWDKLKEFQASVQW